MTYTFVSLTNRKVAIEKIVVAHSTLYVHQERFRLLTHLEATVGTLGPMSWIDRRYMQSHSHEATVAQSQSRSDCCPILLNMQSHCHEATVTHFLICRATVAKPLVISIARVVKSYYISFHLCKHKEFKEMKMIQKL